MQRNCDICGVAYTAKRSTSRYCSTRCRTTATRKGQSRAKVTSLAGLRAFPDASEGPGPIETATRAELDAVGRTDTAAGQRAVMLAKLLDNPPPLNLSAISGWSREHAASLAAATVDVEKPRAKTPLDMVRERRDAKRA